MDIQNIRSGINQNDASIYKIIKLYVEQADEQPNTIPNAQADEQADEHIITKLNLLFNYIYINGCGSEIGLMEIDREYLIANLKRLEIYVNDLRAYELMPINRLLDEKIMMWIIKEIYLSPHRALLNNLKREKLVLRYQKTKKYITSKTNYRIEELINYCIVCVHDELES